MNPIRSPFRIARVRSNLTLRALFEVFNVPVDVERQRREGWCCVGRGMGTYAPRVELPLNLRDDAGYVVGEVAGLQNRGGDLWALLLWHRESERAEAFAARMRGALVTGDVTGYVVAGGEA